MIKRKKATLEAELLEKTPSTKTYSLEDALKELKKQLNNIL